MKQTFRLLSNKSNSAFLLTLCFALLALFPQSCKKNDTLITNDVTNSNVNTSQFFNLPAGTNSAVARVAKELERQNQKTGFISTLATQAGFPVWDKSTIRLLKSNTQNSNSLFEDHKGGDTCILIPMVLLDANHVNAFISATIIDDSVTMRMYYRNDYKAYPLKASQPSPSVTTAEDFALQMMLFDKEVFGYNDFVVKDKRLFLDPTVVKDTNNTKISIKLTPPNTNNLILCTTFEYTASHCEGCTGTCDNCGFPTCWSITISTETCTEVGTTGSGGWPSAPTGPGGTGGGGGGQTGGGNCVVGGLIQNGFAPPNPCNPPTGGNPLPPIPSNVLWLKNTLNLNPNQVDFLIQNPHRADEVYDYLEEETNLLRKEVVIEHIEKMLADTAYLNFTENHAITGDSTKMWWDDETWTPPLNYKSDFDFLTGDFDNNTVGNYDTTTYPIYNLSTPWPTIANVIPTSDFVGWGTPGIKANCMDYAKAQIAKKSKKISNYASNQTIQIYKALTGVDSTKVKDAIGYLISALSRGIPVIVGVDDVAGYPRGNPDKTTDHFIVIVGMGTDATGKYFIFYDNASSQVAQGANANNKLYFNSTTWKISGQSQTSYASGSGMYPYIVTMIRKSK